MTLYQGKYRTETTRRSGHNYTHGTYFVTICTGKQLEWFGEINKTKMLLSGIGEMARQCIEEIPTHFPDTKIDSFVVMPNHIHLILMIVETQNFASLRKNIFGPQSRNLGSIIRGFKIGVKKLSLQTYPDFHWQPRYHDRVIRSEKELTSMRTYIARNSASWDKEPIPWYADSTSWSL